LEEQRCRGSKGQRFIPILCHPDPEASGEGSHSEIYKDLTQYCHFDGGEIFARSSTKIGLLLPSYLRRFLLRRNDKLCVKKTLRPGVLVAKNK
jgi:hypothetical protein